MLIEVRIFACVAMLVVAGIIDIKKREIPDKIWVGFGALGIVLILGELGLLGISFENVLNPATNNMQNSSRATGVVIPYSYFIGIGIVAAISYAIYKTGLFGGADSKALIVIAILMPSWYDGALFKFHGITALTVLTNAVLISLWQMAYNSARNLYSLAKGIPIFEDLDETVTRKALAFAMGYRSKSASGYLFPMESIDESGKRRFRFNPYDYDEFVSESSISGKSVWVTQAMPFIVYIGIGFGIALTIGDLVGAIIRSLISIS